MIPALIVATALAYTGELPQSSPASEVDTAAHAAIALHLPQGNWRFFSTYAIHDDDKKHEAHVALAFLINSVSRSDRCVRPQIIDGTNLVLVNLDRYTRTENRDEFIRAFDAVAAQDVRFAEIYRRTEQTKYINTRTGAFVRFGPPERIITTSDAASWLPHQSLAALQHLTDSKFPVLSLDAFVANASQIADNYYALAGIPPKEDDFFRSIGVTKNSYSAGRAFALASLVKSNVTHTGRVIRAAQTRYGYSWQSLDFANDDRFESDPIANPFDFVHDGTEYFAPGANGMLRFGAADGNGSRVNHVPPEIAPVDYSLPRGAKDKTVRAIISCVTCHNMSKDESGFKSFPNDQLRFLSGNIAGYSHDEQQSDDFRNAHGPDQMSKWLIRSRIDYEDACKEATGTTLYEASAALLSTVSDYEWDLVYPSQAARELGIDEDQLEGLAQTCLAQHRGERESAPSFFGLSLRGIPTMRGRWEREFPFAARIRYGITEERRP